MRCIRQPGELLFRKPSENGMHGLPAHFEITSNRFCVPPIGVQPDDCSSTLSTILDFRIARIAALGCRWFGAGGQDELDGSRGRLAVECDEADRRQLMRSKLWILSMEVYD